MPKSRCRPHWSLTQELNALDDKKAVVGMSVIDNLNASHTTYWRFWSKVLLLLLWWGMGAHGPGLWLLGSKMVPELGGCSTQHSKQLGCGGFIVCDKSYSGCIWEYTMLWVYVTPHSVYGWFSGIRRLTAVRWNSCRLEVKALCCDGWVGLVWFGFFVGIFLGSFCPLGFWFCFCFLRWREGQ